MLTLQQVGGIPFWQFQEWQELPLQHFISTRKGGQSTGKHTSMNLAEHVNDDKKHVVENRQKLAEVLGIYSDKLCFAEQVHGDTVSLIDNVNQCQNAIPQTDALITQVPEIALIMLTADCVPILLYDNDNQAIGAVHAGWRGTVKNIVGNTVKAMQEHFGTKPESLKVGIGPCISAEVYEVGEEVIQHFTETFGSIAEQFVKRYSDKPRPFLDLIKANQHCLSQSGVLKENILKSNICTLQDDEYCFSARRQGIKSGRLASGISLKTI